MTSSNGIAFAALASLGCGFSGASVDGPLAPEYYSVSGAVVDFTTRVPVPITGIEVVGLAGADVIVDGATFEIRNALAFSVVHLTISADGYRDTITGGVEIADADIEGVTAEVVLESYASDLAAAYSAPADAPIVLIQALDETGAPNEDLTSRPFSAVAGGDGPHFLDEFLEPEPERSRTIGPSWLFYVDAPPGVIQLTSAVEPFVVRSASVLAQTGKVSVARATVTEGALDIPVGVSFAEDVVPIFTRRGCLQCHRKNLEGDVIGQLKLEKPKEAYAALVTEISPQTSGPRINLLNPDQSLILTKPSLEDPPDGHPNSTFASPADVDYLTILAWIGEGARDN